MKKIPIINQIIKDKRKEKKITQEEFTKIINKSIATVKRYDTGDIIPENTLILICKKLGLNLYELLKAQIYQNENEYDTFVDTPFEEGGFYYELIKKIEYGESYENINEESKKIELLYSILYDSFYHDTDKLFIEKEFKTFIDSFQEITVKNKYLTEKNIKKDVIVDILDVEEWNELLDEIKRYFNLLLIDIRKKKLYKNNL